MTTCTTPLPLVRAEQAPLDFFSNALLPPELPWAVAFLRKSTETEFQNWCARKGIFCGVLREPKTYANRTTRLIPVFPRYAILRPSPDDCYEIGGNPGVARLVKITDQRRFENELMIARHLVESGQSIHVGKLKLGDGVQISSGPYRGIKGRLAEILDGNRKGESCVVVDLPIMGQIIPLKISACQVERAA